MNAKPHLKRRIWGGWRLVALAGLLAGCGLTDPHQRGERALSTGDYNTAFEAFSDAIESGSYPAEAYANRGIANEALGNFDAAVSDYSRALELLGPDSAERPEVLNNRGVAYLKLVKRDDALKDFSAAIELRPEYAEAYANRGRVYLDLEESESALADLDKAIEIKSDLADAYGNRALLYEGRGDDEQAIRDYTRAIEIGHAPQAYFNRGMLRYTLGCWDLAYEDFTAVVERADENDYLWYQAKSQQDFLANRPKNTNTCLGIEGEQQEPSEGEAPGDTTSEDAPTEDWSSEDTTPEAAPTDAFLDASGTPTTPVQPK